MGHVLRSARMQLRVRPSPAEHVFVLGAPRSGTTLVQTLLAAHSRLWSIEGETGMFTGQDLWDPCRHHLGLEPARVAGLLASSRDVVAFFDAAVRAAAPAARPGARFIEKTPQHVLRLRWLLRRFPASRFVHVVRDGRDAFLSSRSNAWVVQGSDVERYARYWRRCLRARARAGSPPQLLDVRYEDLVAGPEAVLERIMAHLGLPMEPGQALPERRARDRRSAEGAFARLGGPITSASVGRWRTGLEARDAARFVRVAGRELASWGYPTPAA